MPAPPPAEDARRQQQTQANRAAARRIARLMSAPIKWIGDRTEEMIPGRLGHVIAGGVVFAAGLSLYGALYFGLVRTEEIFLGRKGFGYLMDGVILGARIGAVFGLVVGLLLRYYFVPYRPDHWRGPRAG